MSIFSMFSTQKPAPQQQQPQGQQQQQAPQQQTAQQTTQQHVDANPTVPNNNNQPQRQPSATDPNPQSPTDKFAQLWSNDPSAQQPQAPNFNPSREQMQQLTSQMDFGSVASQQDLAAIAGGGEGAVTALQNVLNTLGREVFSKSAQFAGQMTQSGYQVATNEINRGLPVAVRDHMTSAALREANPAMKNPALAPMVGAIQQQMAAKHPNATASELNNLVTDYINTVVAPAFVPTPAVDPAKKASAAAPDFSAWVM